MRENLRACNWLLLFTLSPPPHFDAPFAPKKHTVVIFTLRFGQFVANIIYQAKFHYQILQKCRKEFLGNQLPGNYCLNRSLNCRLYYHPFDQHEKSLLFNQYCYHISDTSLEFWKFQCQISISWSSQNNIHWTDVSSLFQINILFFSVMYYRKGIFCQSILLCVYLFLNYFYMWLIFN